MKGGEWKGQAGSRQLQAQGYGTSMERWGTGPGSLKPRTRGSPFNSVFPAGLQTQLAIRVTYTSVQGRMAEGHSVCSGTACLLCPASHCLCRELKGVISEQSWAVALTGTCWQWVCKICPTPAPGRAACPSVEEQLGPSCRGVQDLKPAEN